jgi:cytoskeletal protein CcmA (bactofilin family)
MGGTCAITGNTTVGGTFGVTGATTVTGALTANGGITVGTTKGITQTVKAHTSSGAIQKSGFVALNMLPQRSK